MTDLLGTTTFTASQARQNFYAIIKSASKGLRAYEVRLRNNEPVVVISKAELESWQETLDILNHPEEVEAIRKARRQKTKLTHSDLLKSLGLNETRV